MKNILLLGELGIDVWTAGLCKKISAEAPVPVFTPLGTATTNPGMAGNVKANLESLAPDYRVHFIHQEKSVYKIRYVDKMSGQQIVRVDIDDDKVEPIFVTDVFTHINDQLNNGVSYDAIVFSDYGKGFLGEDDMAKIAAWAKARDIPTFADTKHLISEWAKDITVIKINRKEADAHGEEPWPHCEYVIVTEGPDGAYLHSRKEPGVFHRVPVAPTLLRNTAGAGDSFLAGLVVSYLESTETDQQTRLIKAIAFANKVAGVAVSKPGVVAVKREEVI